MTPRMAVKGSRGDLLASASITGATAAIAELPQIELPQATSAASVRGRPRARPMRKLSGIASITHRGDAGGDRQPEGGDLA